MTLLTNKDHQKSIRRIERLTDELNKLQHGMLVMRLWG